MWSLWHKDRFAALKRLIGIHKVLTEIHDLAVYAFDATRYRSIPEAVVLAESTEDVQATVKFANENDISITPRGAGSGLSGGSVPIKGGIVLSCEKMKEIISFDPVSRTIITQPGLVTSELQSIVAKKRLFYPPDPSSYTVSTIGGNVAENAGGLRCFKYGVTGNYVTGIEYVDYKGDTCFTGSLNKTNIEPDLTGLLVGSEGTLGILTKIALQLIELPEKTITISCYFNDKTKAFDAISTTLASGITPSILEYIDHRALCASASFMQMDYSSETKALVLIECDGDKERVKFEVENLQKSLSPLAISLEIAEDDKQRERLWQLRRGVSPSLTRLSDGRIHEDVAVPCDKLSNFAQIVEDIGSKYGLEIPVYGHAGDGNLHIVILYDISDSKTIKKAEDAAKNIFKAAIDLGGTITGEHGIGMMKKEFLPWQISNDLLKYQKQIKQHFDPQGVFNPDKLF